MNEEKNLWNRLEKKVRQGMEIVEETVQLARSAMREVVADDCEEQNDYPAGRNAEESAKIAENRTAEEQRELMSALLAPTGALAAAALMLSAQRQGNTAVAQNMVRLLRQRMDALEVRFPEMKELASGTPYGRMIAALKKIARADSARPEFAAWAQWEIDSGLSALPENVREDLLSITEFSALRPA